MREKCGSRSTWPWLTPSRRSTASGELYRYRGCSVQKRWNSGAEKKTMPPREYPGPSKKEFKSLKISAPGKSRGIWNGIGKSLINMDIFCCWKPFSGNPMEHLSLLYTEGRPVINKHMFLFQNHPFLPCPFSFFLFFFLFPRPFFCVINNQKRYDTLAWAWTIIFFHLKIIEIAFVAPF